MTGIGDQWATGGCTMSRSGCEVRPYPVQRTKMPTTTSTAAAATVASVTTTSTSQFTMTTTTTSTSPPPPPLMPRPYKPPPPNTTQVGLNNNNYPSVGFKPVPPPKPLPRPPSTPLSPTFRAGRPTPPPKPVFLSDSSSIMSISSSSGRRRPLTCVNDMAQNPLYMCRYLHVHTHIYTPLLFHGPSRIVPVSSLLRIRFLFSAATTTTHTDKKGKDGGAAHTHTHTQMRDERSSQP